MKYHQIIASEAFRKVTYENPQPLDAQRVTFVPADGFEVYVSSEVLARVGSTKIERIIRFNGAQAYRIIFVDERMGNMPFGIDEDVKLLAYKTVRVKIDLEA